MELKKSLKSLLFGAIVLIGISVNASAQTQQDTTAVAATIQAPISDYENPKQYVIGEINVTGVKYIGTALLTSMASIKSGDTITIPGAYLSSGLRKLMDMHLFSDANITVIPREGNIADLEIFLQERPRVMTWEITGLSKSNTKELSENLKLKDQKGRELSDFVIDSSKEGIFKYMYDKGYLNAQIDVLQRVDTSFINSMIVTFAITKNEKVKVGKITFQGNDTFQDKRLRRTFKKNHQVSINLFRNAKFKKKEFEQDKDYLIDFYQSKGYRNAMVVGDSIYNISPNRLAINVKVEEGNQFFIRNITWTGNSVYSTGYLSDTILLVNSGDVYDKMAINKRLGIGREPNPDELSVMSLYQNGGYLHSNIVPFETVAGSDSIDLDIKVFEGDQARINKVEFTGNYKIDDEVIRREMYVRPGELYNRALFMQTYRQLATMEHFMPELIKPDIVPVSNDLANVSFALTEQASDKFNVSGGVGQGMFVGSIGVQFSNLSLRRFFKKDAWRPYPGGQSQTLGITGTSNGTYYKAISLNFVEPWLGGKKPNSLSVGAFYSSQNNAYILTQKGTKHFRTIGGSVGIGRRLKWPDGYFTLYNEISYQAYNMKDWDSFLVTNGTSNLIQIKTVFGRNSVDQPTYPRRGSDFSLSISLTPPYSLFDNKDYSSNLSDIERYRLIEFHKWKMHAQWYTPLSSDSKIVLMAKVELGYLGAYDKYKVSPFEGFEVGGSGMSGYTLYGVDVIAMRGYKDASLTPQGEAAASSGMNARAFNKYTLELRYPLLMQPQATVYGLIFGEAGNAFDSWQAFDPFTLKRSVGFGARMFLPMLGLMGIDWGYGFDRVPGESKKSGSQFHFVIGGQF